MQQKKPKRIDQFLANFVGHDAISNEVRHLQGFFREAGFQSEIFAESWDKKGEEFGCRHFLDYSPYDSPESAVLFQFAIGGDYLRFLPRLKAFKISRYQSITTPKYFKPLRELNPYYEKCREGLIQRRIFRDVTDHSWASSSFSKEELVKDGYKSIDLLPVVRDYERLTGLDDQQRIKNLLQDGKKNILFVGRLVPNKAQHDLLVVFKIFQTNIAKETRLILAGSPSLMAYSKELLTLAKRLDLKIVKGQDCFSERGKLADVFFTNEISDSELASFYRHSHLFLSLSEHEGFCVPLVEAMNFGLPILAHNEAAIEETAGDGGVVFEKNDLFQTISLMKEVLFNESFATKLRGMSKKRAGAFLFPVLQERFSRCLDRSVELFSLP